MNASPTARVLAINVYVDVVECWRCHKSSPVVIGFDNPVTGCPQAVDERFVEELADTSHRAFRTQVGLGALKRRWSRTAGASYWSQGCASCDALFGAFPLREQFIETDAYGALPELRWPQPLHVALRAVSID